VSDGAVSSRHPSSVKSSLCRISATSPTDRGLVDPVCRLGA
jgi:hypothetical protein